MSAVAALFVDAYGCYASLPDVDPWPEARDARLYAGPYPVIAHPPCARWGRYWGGAPCTWPRLTLGDDGGCFASALAVVRRYGGVLEHPEGSHAWRAFGLLEPPREGGWVRADWLSGFAGWTCCVEQGAYGHRARKATWLYAHGVELPSLKWGPAKGDFLKPEDGFHTPEERARRVKTGICQRLSHRERAATPIPFRDLLLSIARSVMTTPSFAAMSSRRQRRSRPGCAGFPVNLASRAVAALPLALAILFTGPAHAALLPAAAEAAEMAVADVPAPQLCGVTLDGFGAVMWPERADGSCHIEDLRDALRRAVAKPEPGK